jgi:hypothetical protein
MRFAAAFLALICAALLPSAAWAAIAIEEHSNPAAAPMVGVSEFSEGGPRYLEKQRKFSLEQQKRARLKSQVKGIVMIVAPVVLIVLITFLYMRARSEGSRRRSTHRKLKQAEVRRRSGGPEQLLDPRQW